MLPDRIWIHPGDSLQLYITNAVEGADAYTRESEQAIVVSEKSARAVMGWVVASVKDNGWCDVDRAIALLREGASNAEDS